MSADKRKNQNTKSSPPKVAPRPVATPPPPVPPLFRPVDWLAFGISTLVVFIVFFLTLAPNVTLEDSGEMATASLYGGIPHAPGYPVWTLYTWLWTHIPYGSIAWRVELGNAFAGAIAAGLLALVVSRSSSMIIESIDAFKNINRRWENLICLVAGFVAGGLSDFDGFMWSQAVIVDKHTLSIASLLGVLVFLLRWVYAPHQHRYLYAAFFMYGICFNNHQSLLPIIMGMQVLMWMAEPKLGREFFFGNTMIFLACEFLIKPGVAHEQPNGSGGLQYHRHSRPPHFGSGWSSKPKRPGLNSAAMRRCSRCWVAWHCFSSASPTISLPSIPPGKCSEALFDP